ncbi:GNAT family N-acetyltransferase [Glycomyces buryatensis]|uniref:N-acetyltransferase n=1 Tax=Glycomyces buryatensis TaxID=2570927 RepID=A0A4V4HSI6_9ACTN|nr:N-acetyltransferase [Glycomyces buryatensis]THV41866.1 N-acetyltransferase [Glycomyces buryatensis]
MEIRAEAAGDHEAVRRVHELAFGDSGPRVADLNDALRETSDALSLVAVGDGQIVGHVMFTTSLLDAPRELVKVPVLSPIGVLPERHGQGIGSALVRRGLEILDSRGAPLVFLEGHPGFYSKVGFKAGGELGFRKPSLRIPDAAFQVYPLAAYQDWMNGTLVYSQDFWDHDSVGLRDPSA